MHANGIKYMLDDFSLSARQAPSMSMSIRNIKNLSLLSLVNTMLTEESFKIIIENLPTCLSGLNLSKNEHLTNKCYRMLHNIPHLTHLTLDKCNISDDIANIILDLDPHSREDEDGVPLHRLKLLK